DVGVLPARDAGPGGASSAGSATGVVAAPGAARMRRPSWFSVALAAQLAAVTGFSVGRGSRRIIAYLIVWSVLALLVRAGHRRWPLPRATLVALAVAGGLHLAGGLLPSPDPGAPILYETWLIEGVLKFDQLAHAIISGVLTVALFQILGQCVDPRRAGPVPRAMLALVATWGFGAANELFEFLSALRFADAYVGGFNNAGWDLVFNTFGSLMAALWCALTASPAQRVVVAGLRLENE
ncbi:MAG: hypothetical protein ACRDZ7_04260, partial [Acidimicrobiia bacterium]